MNLNADLGKYKRKVVNDPIYGFISIPNEFIFNLVEHPYFQRLRKISQLGLTYLVYPGANHTRFQHALGALHLMCSAIEILRQKGVEITEDEANGAMGAILLHDIGHGPFSHALENSLIEGVNHEKLSQVIMHKLNVVFNGELDLSLKIFNNKYHKNFLHQLVSGQLDMDRLDYLKRDSFFSGVSEGVIGSQRIIKMLDVKNDQLVVESKGIYSIEKFLVARRLMYWQVYLHRTVLGAEFLLLKILKRAKYLYLNNQLTLSSGPLQILFSQVFTETVFFKDEMYLNAFLQLDDTDIISQIKIWQYTDDFILSFLSKSLIDRKLFKSELSSSPKTKKEVQVLHNNIQQHFKIDQSATDWLFIEQKITNFAYDKHLDKINILFKNGTIKDIAEAADLLNISALSEGVNKYLTCYPRLN